VINYEQHASTAYQVITATPLDNNLAGGINRSTWRSRQIDDILVPGKNKIVVNLLLIGENLERKN
jgi:hypothetical protein